MTDNTLQPGLESDARQLRQRLLTGDLEADTLNCLEALREFREASGWSLSRIGDALGVHKSTVGAFLNGKYNHESRSFVNKISHFLESYYRRQRHRKPPVYIETTVAKQIAVMIKQTEAFSTEYEGKIGLIIGDGGHGKSHCLRAYCQANQNTVLAELDAVMTTKQIFQEIARALRLDSSGAVSAITRRLISSLKSRHLIVMLDEASNLTAKQLNQLRQIIVVKSRCPLVLAGNSDLLKTVMQPSDRKGYESLDQFTSRLMGVLNLDRRAGDGDGGLYTVTDMRQLYEYGGICLADDAARSLKKIAKTPKSGRLRTCGHIVSALHNSGVAHKSGLITAELIAAAIEELNLPVKARLPLSGQDDLTQVVAVAKTA